MAQAQSIYGMAGRQGFTIKNTLRGYQSDILIPDITFILTETLPLQK